MELSSLLDASHLASFVGGTAVGAAGTYFAEKFTDSRRRKEHQAEKRALFKKLRNQMPELLKEMKSDLDREKSKFIREFVVLPNERVIFDSDRERLAYYENTHSGLRNKMAALASAGFLVLLKDGHAPIYRLSEDFVDRLQSDA